MFQPHDTITRILRQHPAASRVFERHGMDYCCAGGTTLEAACLERGTPVESLIADLEELLAPADAGPEIDGLTLPDLVAHIRSTHHASLREELPRLDAMTERVALVHGNRNPRLQAVHETWTEVALLARAHLEKTERFLFPVVEQPDGSAATGPDTVRIRAEVVQEGEWLTEGIGRLRELTESYIAPPWACGTYRAMLEALARFETDTLAHLRTEETRLFPRIPHHEPTGAH